MQRRIGDRQRAEALFIVTLSFLALGLVLTLYLTWALIETGTRQETAGPAGTAYWIAQLGSFLFVVLTCIVGFKPSITVRCAPQALLLRQGRHRMAVAYEDILALESTPALVYHRHYKRYAAIRAFVNRMPAEILVLHTLQGPVALGLTVEEQHLLSTFLTSRTDAVTAPVHARVA